MLRYPMLVINTKAYGVVDNKKAVKLAKTCDKAMKEENKTVILALEPTQLGFVNSKEPANLFAQHVDSIEPGAHTGYVLAESVKDQGAIGTILNHSEHRLKITELEQCIRRANEVGLLTLVCAKDASEAGKLAKLKPAMIAVEPPELIGGDISVSTAKPEIITDTISAVKKVANIPVLCGAGVKTKGDVAESLRLGAKGVLVASAVAKSEQPHKVVKELLKGL